jgi:hypothetical protein
LRTARLGELAIARRRSRAWLRKSRTEVSAREEGKKIRMTKRSYEESRAQLAGMSSTNSVSR